MSGQPLTTTVLDGQNGDFRDAVAAALPGGTQLTAIKNAKREILVESLRKNAWYVQINASHNLDVLLSSDRICWGLQGGVLG